MLIEARFMLRQAEPSEHLQVLDILKSIEELKGVEIWRCLPFQPTKRLVFVHQLEHSSTTKTLVFTASVIVHSVPLQIQIYKMSTDKDSMLLW